MTSAHRTLQDLGWQAFFSDQIDDASLTPAKVSSVHRTAISALAENGPTELILPPGESTAGIAVGDWVLCDAEARLIVKRLDRKSTLQRGQEYHSGARQLIAANIDTMFVTTSCNADFNVARLERYLALAYDAGITPVILLTKADQADDAPAYLAEAQTLGPDLAVRALNAKGDVVADLLAPWIGAGQTVALVGSSGVGKTTLANALTGGHDATQDIREDDARGRHTTTKRSLHSLPTGGWLIDTPGMRGLGVADVAAGIDATFPEISALVDQCRFRDCKHEAEPGCAVLAAIDAGDVTAERLARYRKLRAEDAVATRPPAQRFTKPRKPLPKNKKRR